MSYLIHQDVGITTQHKRPRLFIDDKEIVVKSTPHIKPPTLTKEPKQVKKSNPFDALVDSDSEDEVDDFYVPLTKKAMSVKKATGAWTKKLVVKPGAPMTPARGLKTMNAPNAPKKKTHTTSRILFDSTAVQEKNELTTLVLEQQQEIEDMTKLIADANECKKPVSTKPLTKWTPEMDNMEWGDMVDYE